MKRNGFNPEEVEQYVGRTFTTQSGSSYYIAPDRTLHRTGRRTTGPIQIIPGDGYYRAEPENISPADMEGAMVKLIAGIEPKSYDKIAGYFTHSGSALDENGVALDERSIPDLIHELGKPVEAGLHLMVVGTTFKSLIEGRNLYCLTSLIKPDEAPDGISDIEIDFSQDMLLHTKRK